MIVRYLFDLSHADLAEELERVEQERLRRGAILARQSLAQFVPWLFEKVNGFAFEMMWYHTMLLDIIENQLLNPDHPMRNLMVMLPPQHGKTELLSRLLIAWLFGQDPSSMVFSATYDQVRARSVSNDVKRYMGSRAYQEVYPGVTIGQGRYDEDTGLNWNITGHRGKYMARGSGQGAEGVNKSKILILDDLVNQQQYESKAKLRSVIKWYAQSLSMRGMQRIMISTPWGLDDPAHYLLKVAKKNPRAAQWHVIKIPVLMDEAAWNVKHPQDPREIGEVLCPHFMTKEEALAQKALDPVTFVHQYQMRTTKPGGNIIKNKWVKRFYTLPSMHGEWLQSWDLRAGGESEKTSDAVGQLWFRPRDEPANLYIVDTISGKWDFVETLEVMREVQEKPLWCLADEKLVERKADGISAINMLKQEIPGIVPKDPGRDSKEARLSAVAPFWQAGNIRVRDGQRWTEGFIAQHTGFPSYGKDDHVDASSQVIAHAFVKTDEDAYFYEDWGLATRDGR